MATRKLVVEGSSVTASQLKDLFRQIEVGSLTGFHLQAILEHRDPFKVAMDKDSQLASWQVFLTETFGIEIDVESLSIPEQQPGFDRLIVVPKGITINQVLKACSDEFGVNSYSDNLDKSVTKNDRLPTETYAVWVRERVEADEELAGKSANDLAEEKIQGITLLERLLYERKYFAETSKHLDIKNVTLCSGSRYSDGDVSSVNWDPDCRELYVGWCYPDYRSPCIRSRAVVS